MLKRAMLWLRANLRRGRYEREMRDEMEEHLDRAAMLLMARGLPADEARRQAIREFGDVAYHHTYAREARGTLWLDDLLGDGRFALRHFGRKPGTTVMMFIVLAFGMSISTLLFSWVHGLSVLPPAAVTRADDLVRIRGSSGEEDTRRFGEDEFFAYRSLSSHFAAVAGWMDLDGVLQSPDDVERRGHQADLMFVTGDYFGVLGIQPIRGAGLPTGGTDDPAANAVAVIDHQAWQELYGERHDILGSIATINGVAFTIVGVAPERFNGAGTKTGMQVWLPLSARHLVVTDPMVELAAIARLRPGVTREAATAAVETIAARADTTAGSISEVVPLLAGNLSTEFDSDIGLITFLLGVLGTLVLLVTCTNVSALLTGLASARRHEIAVRLSLGAARRRIIRQLLTESAVLAVVAGAGALIVAALLLESAAALDTPLDLGIDWPTTAFTFAIALAVGILFGLSPALHATRLALASVLRDSTGGIASSRARLQRGLVVAQVAFTQPLIVVMVTMLFFHLSETQPVTNSDSADRVITVRVQTPTSMAWDNTPESGRRQRDLMVRVRDQVRALPGVEKAVIEWPQLFHPGDYSLHADDIPGAASPAIVSLAVQRAEADHFEVLDIPLRSGRKFNPGDVTAAASGVEAPVIIGADLASHLWGGADAVGRRLLRSEPEPDDAGVSGVAGQLRALVVVGVVDNPVARTGASDEFYRVYLPVDTAASAEFVLIRTAGTAALLLPTIRGLVQKNATSTIIDAQTMAQVEEEINRERRSISGVLSAAGIAALLLSAIGLYAVIAFTVAQRTQEIAVRLAVGARRSQVAYQFVSDGVRLGVLGLILGLPVGLLAMRQVVAVHDIGAELRVGPIILIASAGIFLVAIASAWGPALRAAAVDPATALRRG